jgi:hypothetical protein
MNEYDGMDELMNLVKDMTVEDLYDNLWWPYRAKMAK